MPHPRIQSLTFTAGLFFGVLVLATAASSIWLSVQLRGATEVIERHDAVLGLLDDLERTLWARSRAANLALATGKADRLRSVAPLDAETERLLRRVEGLTAQQNDVRLLRAVREARTDYLTRSARASSSDLPLDARLAALRDEFDQLMTAIGALRRYHAAEVVAARAYGDQLEKAAWILGATASVLGLLGIAGLLWVVRRHVIAPLLSLRDIVAGWRAGEPRQEAPERGPREISEIARSFNLMSAELVRQREAQLTFLAGVAHDLRNPLNGLAMAAAAMRDVAGEGGPATGRIAAMVERQVGHLDRMVGDLLDITRIEAGQLTLELQTIDLRPIITEVADLYAPTALDHPIRLCLPNNPVCVRADPVRVEQVVANLVSNAIKYSPQGAPVGVDLRCSASEAWIDVEDGGSGIPEEDLASIFEPFRRRRASMDAAPGTGLGLSIVRRICRAHGGEVEVSSPPGKGALFRVRLPLEDADAEAPRADADAKERMSASPRPLTPRPT